VSRISIGGDTLALTIGRTRTALLPPSLARVADHVVRGASDKEIATELGASISTIRTYVRRIYERLGVRSRVQLAKVWKS
jgi:DNA-binding NarL/FixJ family response regulator